MIMKNCFLHKKGKKVAVIGTGASAVQCVPNIAGDVSELHVFQRTPGWVPPRLDFEYPAFLQSIFSTFPFVMRLHRCVVNFWTYSSKKCPELKSGISLIYNGGIWVILATQMESFQYICTGVI